MASASVTLEVCVDSIESALAARAGGADRIELCDNLVEAGTTPSAGTLALCLRRLHVPVFVLVRPRGGDFLYTDAEREVMLHDVEAAREAGAQGIVTGALRADGSVDTDLLVRLVRAAGPLEVTFHRAIDVCRDPRQALEDLVEAGVSRVLTSGQATTALEGAFSIAALVRQARARVRIVAAGGVNEDNAPRIVAATGVQEIHVRCASRVASPMEHRNPRLTLDRAHAPDGFTREVTDANRVRRVLAALGRA